MRKVQFCTAAPLGAATPDTIVSYLLTPTGETAAASPILPE